jgi:hypothetical protein
MTRAKVNMGTLRHAAYNRARGCCEISGRPLGHVDGGWELHHRRNKGMGGTSRDDTDTLPNVLALHPDVHNGGPDSVHGRRRWSEERGYLIPKDVDDPWLWPVWLLGREWVLLTASGAYASMPGHVSAPGDPPSPGAV